MNKKVSPSPPPPPPPRPPPPPPPPPRSSSSSSSLSQADCRDRVPGTNPARNLAILFFMIMSVGVVVVDVAAVSVSSFCCYRDSNCAARRGKVRLRDPPLYPGVKLRDRGGDPGVKFVAGIPESSSWRGSRSRTPRHELGAGSHFSFALNTTIVILVIIFVMVMLLLPLLLLQLSSLL